MKHKAFEFKNPAQMQLDIPPVPKNEDVVHEAIMLPTEIKEFPKTHKELMEDRKSQIIAEYDIPEELTNEIRLVEDEFSEDNLELGCYIGKPSLHDYLEARAIEDLARQYGIPKNLLNEVRLTKYGPMIGSETFEAFQKRVESQNKDYKKRVEKSQEKTKKHIQKYYPHWTANYYDN
jgi:hypothetical protein